MCTKQVWQRILGMAVVFAVSCFVGVYAQNKQSGKDADKNKKPAEGVNVSKIMKEARTAVKSSNFAQAESVLEKAMNSSDEARNDASLHFMLMNVEHGLVDAENRKIYLKNNPDTAKYFSYIYKVYKYGLSCDSLDRLPDRKGKVRPRYSSGISSRLLFYRNNVKSAGKYFYKKGKYSDAYKYFDLYLETMHNPLVCDVKDAKPDADSLDIMRLAVYSAYNSSAYSNVKKYISVVMEDTISYTTFCQIGSNASFALGDTLEAIDYLNKGWKADPSREYFYITLVECQIDRKQYDKAYTTVCTQLDRTPQNRRLWYIKGKCLQCMDSLDSAIASYERAVAIQNDDTLSYSSMGDIYVIKAQQTYHANNFKAGTTSYSQLKKQETEFYKKALGNYEKARSFAPNNPILWYEGLREVYFKLNMGKQLNKLEKEK